MKVQVWVIRNHFQKQKSFRKVIDCFKKKQVWCSGFLTIAMICSTSVRANFMKTVFLVVDCVCFLSCFLKIFFLATPGIHSLTWRVGYSLRLLLRYRKIVVPLNTQSPWNKNWTRCSCNQQADAWVELFPTCLSIVSYHCFQWMVYGNRNQIRNSILESGLQN